MKKRWYWPFALLGLLSALTVLIWRPEDGTLIYLLTGPLVLLGRGLRALSESGRVGNGAAWCIYLAVSFAPLGGLLLLRKRARWEDSLLVLLSGALLGGLYYLVNPSLLSPELPDMTRLLCAQGILAVAVSWGVLRLLDSKKPEKLLKILLNVLAAVFVLAAWGTELGAMLQKLDEIRQANTMGSLGMTETVLVLRYLVTAFGLMLNVWMLRGGLDLLDAFSHSAYSQRTVEAANRLTRRCTVCLRLLVLTSLGVNLLQLLLTASLRDIRLDVSLPISSMVLILCLILLCRLLARGKALQDDSDLII